MSDGFSLLKISCLCSQVLIWFVQLQRGERQGGMRRSFWKQPERGIYPLCLNWLVSDLSKNFWQKIVCFKSISPNFTHLTSALGPCTHFSCLPEIVEMHHRYYKYSLYDSIFVQSSGGLMFNHKVTNLSPQIRWHVATCSKSQFRFCFVF